MCVPCAKERGYDEHAPAQSKEKVEKKRQDKRPVTEQAQPTRDDSVTLIVLALQALAEESKQLKEKVALVAVQQTAIVNAQNKIMKALNMLEEKEKHG